jgi:homoserine dehydrogenase
MINIAVLGYGTIGSGVAAVLKTNRGIIARKAGEEIGIKYILDLRDFPDDENADRIIHDYSVILQDPEIRIVVEAMGGVEPAYTFARQAIEAGKHFVTSNKALIAEYGAELIALGASHRVNVFFEASVGGGIPILRPLNTSLSSEDILEITGILNGTTNYMLTKMSEEGSEFADVLKEAQEKGYAEADPTADIEGYDACRKIAILTSLAAGRQVNYTDIHTEGITSITAADMKYAAAMNRRIKLLATSRKAGDSYCVMVAPFLIGADHPLSMVNDVFNAVFVRGNMVGETMFYGAGAGALPTASAVVADIIDAARHMEEHTPIQWDPENLTLVSEKKMACAYFVRTTADPEAIEDAFGNVTYVKAEGIEGEQAFVTGIMDGATYAEAAGRIDGIIQMIRVN